MIALEVMEKYGWDWYTYQNQPSWLLELASQKLHIEARLSAQKEAEIKAEQNG